jgi:Domain of unknown function (DUF4832)
MNGVGWLSCLLSVVAVCFIGFGARAFAGDAPVIIRPPETDELLANPGMGWQTFGEFTSRTDKNLPAWIPSTVHYIRWGWIDLESQPGVLNVDLIDRALRETRDAGQKLAFRVKACSPNLDMPNGPTKPVRFHPLWLKEAGGRELMVDYNGSAPVIPIPDFDDPVTLRLHLDFIKRLGERYDGHPDLDHVDLGSLGWWGEWHLSRSRLAKMPSAENCRKVVNAYLAAFRKTPLIMLINGGEFTTYATQHGAGWRADSLGDLGTFSPTSNHMRNNYPEWIAQTRVEDVWKTAPIAFEPPATVAEFVEKRWPLRWIFNYGLALHGSYFNGKSAELPDDPHLRSELERFLRRLGYRLVLKEVTHSADVRSGATFEILTKWQNIGSAPCYRPYRVAYRFVGSDGYRKVIVGAATVNRWLPGSIELFTDEFFKEPKDLPPGPVNEVADHFRMPDDLPPGEYVMSIGVVEESTTQPVVRLGIAGRDRDGWYPLSRVKVLR